MTITIELTTEEEQSLKEMAHQRGIDAQELARSAVRDLLCKPDAEVQAIIDRVFEKNAELFNRLA